MERQSQISKKLFGLALLLAVVFTALLGYLARSPIQLEVVPQWMAFLGRFHPLIVHLPIGFIMAMVAIEIGDLLIKSVKLHHATFIMSWLAAGSAVLSAILGFFLAAPGSYNPELLQNHIYTGVGTAIWCVWLVVLKMRTDWSVSRVSLPFHGAVAVTLVVLTMAGHYGGALTHGSDYLTANMPDKLKMVLGVATSKKSTTAAVDPKTEPMARPVYATVIDPILQDKCVSCHGTEKQENQLRLDTFAAAIKGGKNGSNIVAKSAAASLMIQTLHLPKDDKKRMPPDGKPQLSADEKALLAWWIDAGASDSAKFAEVKMSKVIARILRDRAGLPVGGPEAAPMEKIEVVMPIAQKIGAELGTTISPVSAKDAGLQLTYIIGAKSIGDAELEKVIALKSNLVRLDLSGSAVTDKGLASIAQLKNLKRLDLSRTAVTDAGIAQLAALKQLEYLNLYGTQITDASLASLRGIESLKKVYLWQTAVTPAASEEFQRAFIDEGQLADWKKQIAEIQAKISGMGVDVNLGAALSAPASTGAAPTSASAPATATTTAKPINAKCPIKGSAPDASITSIFEGKLIAFCCNNCKAKFDATPAQCAKNIPELKK